MRATLGAGRSLGMGEQASASELAEALGPVVELIRSGRLDAAGIADGLLALAVPVEPEPRPAELVDARELAAAIGASAEWVRSHADQLGAVRLGDGPRPRLRFDVEGARAALAATSRLTSEESPTATEPVTTGSPARRRRRERPPLPARVDLLPARPAGGH